MRANLNQIERIDQFLRGELSASEKTALENELQNNPELQEKLESQQLIQEAVQRLSIKNLCENIAIEGKYIQNKSHLSKNWIWYLSSLIILVGLFFFMRPNEEKETPLSAEELTVIQDSVESVMAKEDPKYWIDTPCDSIETELPHDQKLVPVDYKEVSFSIDTKQNNVIEGPEGTVIFVPKDAFETMDGKPLNSSQVMVGLVEALDLKTMMQYQLATLSNKDILSSGGMIRISAQQEGKEVRLKKGKAFEIQIPTTEVNPNMMAWEGVEQANGRINWENPKKIENFLNRVPFEQLDFLPIGFGEVVREGLPYRNYKQATKKNVEEIYYQLDGKNGSKTPIQYASEIVMNAQPEEFSTNYIRLTGKLEGQNPIDWMNTRVTVESQNSNISFSTTISVDSENLFSIYVPNTLYKYRINVHTACENIILKNVQFNRGNEVNTIKINNKLCPRLDFTNKKTPPQRITPSSDSLPTGDSCITCYIDPLKIKSIQTQKFANTFVGTREFEERLRLMHQQKNGTELLNIYLKNLSKNLWECDSMAARIASAAAKASFEKWASLKCTNVRDANSNQVELEKYLNQQRAQFLKERDAILTQYRKEDQKKIDEIQADLVRLQKEKDRELVKITRTRASINVTSLAGVTNTYKTSWYKTGWVNIDCYLHELEKGGEYIVAIDVKGGPEEMQVYQTIPIVNTILPLNDIEGRFSAHFPKSKKGLVKSVYAFAIAKKNGVKYFGIQEFDANNTQSVSITMAPKSEREIAQILEKLPIKAQRELIIDQILLAEVQKVQQYRSFVATRPFISPKVLELNKKMDAKTRELNQERQRQEKEALFTQRLINYIDPCFENQPQTETQDATEINKSSESGIPTKKKGNKMIKL